MSIEELRAYCLSLPNVTEGVKWESNLAFMLFEKIFLLAGLETQPTKVIFKVSPEDFNDLVSIDGCGQAPYFARGQWVVIHDIKQFTDQQLIAYIKNSYELIKAKLPKKQQVLCKD